MRRDVLDLIKRAESAGAEYAGLSGKSHPILKVNGRKVFLPGTPGGGNRSIKNSIAQLRKMGLDI